MEKGKVREQQVPMESVYPITIGPDYRFIRTDLLYGIYSTIAYSFFVVVVGWGFFGIVGKHRIEGKEKLRSLKKKGFITVANHCHIFDTIMTAKVFYPRLAWFASVQRNFEAPFYRKLFPMLRAFPIPDGPLGLRRITKPVVEAVKDGKIVHLFPEAELWHLYQGIGFFQRGAFYLAHAAGCPVVPMVHLFKPRAFFGKPVSRNVLTIKTVVGDPVYPEVPAGEGGKVDLDSVTRMCDAVRQWMEAEVVKYHGKAVGTEETDENGDA